MHNTEGENLARGAVVVPRRARVRDTTVISFLRAACVIQYCSILFNLLLAGAGGERLARNEEYVDKTAVWIGRKVGGEASRQDEWEGGNTRGEREKEASGA
jgi:hypothetical protein